MKRVAALCGAGAVLPTVVTKADISKRTAATTILKGSPYGGRTCATEVVWDEEMKERMMHARADMEELMEAARRTSHYNRALVFSGKRMQYLDSMYLLGGKS
jgi:hypothetical protein